MTSTPAPGDPEPLRLTRVVTRGVPRLPDVAVDLEPVTAVIGPSLSGKSRLLATIAWLLSGRPTLGPGASRAHAEAELGGPEARRSIVRVPGSRPGPPLPSVRFLPARRRLTARRTVDPNAPWSDATGAEAMIDRIEAAVAAGSRDEVLLIEEPELMLTPQAQRYLYRLLRRYAELNQVIYSTRSPALVDAVHPTEIVRLDLVSAGLSVRHAPAELLSDEQRLRLAAEFDHERSEMFFARAVVLVEGQTERLSFPSIFRGLGYDPDALGISIVEVGGKGNLVLAARLLGELGIAHVVVHDADTGVAAAAENAEIAREAAPAPVFQLVPDFEGVAQISSHDEKVLHAWRRFSAATPEEVPGQFARIVDAAVSLATAGPAPVPGRRHRS